MDRCWAVEWTDAHRLHVTEMRMSRFMCGVTRMDKVRNEYNKLENDRKTKRKQTAMVWTNNYKK